MTLIKSISGIRGTIGGKVGDNLTPVDAVKFASAYGTFLKNNSSKEWVWEHLLKGTVSQDKFGVFSHELLL